MCACETPDTPTPYADEEVASDCRYPNDFAVQPIELQVPRIASFFGLFPDGATRFTEKVLPGLDLPKGSDGWFAIPSIDAVAGRFFPSVKDLVERNSRSVGLVHEMLGASRKFHNHWDGQLAPDRLHPHPQTVKMLQILQKQQPGDILIVAGQLGIKYRGLSVRKARAVFEGDEFGAGAFAGACILLTHPMRLGAGGGLFMDLPGDECAGGGDRFNRAPYLRYDGRMVEFGTHSVRDFCWDFGSVSFRLPPPQQTRT